jgi:hypothetical protein
LVQILCTDLLHRSYKQKIQSPTTRNLEILLVQFDRASHSRFPRFLAKIFEVFTCYATAYTAEQFSSPPPEQTSHLPDDAIQPNKIGLGAITPHYAISMCAFPSSPSAFPSACAPPHCHPPPSSLEFVVVC